MLIEEPGSEVAHLIWNAAHRSVSSRLLYPETCAALARAARSRRLTRRVHAAAKAELENLSQQIDWSELTDPIARRAGELAERHALPGADALHLAAAETLADEESVIVTADLRLRAAAQRIGLATARLDD